MRRRFLAGAAFAVLVSGGLIVVVRQPCLEAAQADWRAMVLRELSTRVQRFRASTGHWPQQVEALAPPSCTGDTCLLDETSLRNVQSAELRVIAADGLLLCFEGECRFVGPSG